MITSRPSSYCCIFHNKSNGYKIVMKCVVFFMFILYIFSQEIYGDNIWPCLFLAQTSLAVKKTKRTSGGDLISLLITATGGR